MRPAIVAAVLAALLVSPAYSAESDAETHAENRPAESATDSGSSERNRDKDTPRRARTGDDLESCKRDADGMRGPERSRFMTQCLRERK